MKAVIHKKKTIFYLVKVKDQKAFGVATLLFYLPQAPSSREQVYALAPRQRALTGS